MTTMVANLFRGQPQTRTVGTTTDAAQMAARDVNTGVAGTGIPASTLVSGALTGFSAMNQIQAADIQAEQLELEAGRADLEAQQAELRGQQEQNEINERLITTLARQRAATAGSGIDVSAGTPETAREEAVRQANRSLSVAEAEADLNRLGAETRGRTLLLQRESVEQRGRQRAIRSLGDFAFQELRRQEREEAFENEIERRRNRRQRRRR